MSTPTKIRVPESAVRFSYSEGVELYRDRVEVVPDAEYAASAPSAGTPTEAGTASGEVHSLVERACRIIELGDDRLLASDGPAGNQPPDLSLREWRELYVCVDKARKALAAARSGAGERDGDTE